MNGTHTGSNRPLKELPRIDGVWFGRATISFSRSVRPPLGCFELWGRGEGGSGRVLRLPLYVTAILLFNRSAVLTSLRCPYHLEVPAAQRRLSHQYYRFLNVDNIERHVLLQKNASVLVRAHLSPVSPAK